MNTRNENYHSEEVLMEMDAAEYLGLSRSTLRQSRMNGVRERHVSSPPYVKIGRSIRYLKSDLNKWLEEHKHVPNRVPARGGAK